MNSRLRQLTLACTLSLAAVDAAGMEQSTLLATAQEDDLAACRQHSRDVYYYG